MRILDSKDPGLAPLIASAPAISGALDEASAVHFAEVQRLLRKLKIPFALNPRLVRGLDYYTRTAFEFVADDPALGTATTVCGKAGIRPVVGVVGRALDSRGRLCHGNGEALPLAQRRRTARTSAHGLSGGRG